MATWAQNEMATLSTTGKRLLVQRLWLVFCLVMPSTFSADAMSIGRGGYSGKYSNGKKGNEQERQEEIDQGLSGT